MAEYTLTLRTESDYRMIKKLLRAFDGAVITPVKVKKNSLDKALKEVRDGHTVGPFNSVDDFMADLLR